jgi:hypothetical protein
VTPKAPKRSADNLGTPLKAPELVTVPKPIEVVVKLSDKSFLSPILGDEAGRYDICINVFYNGEFNASQVIKYNTWAANESKSYMNFGGRRIETCHELPWMITTKSEDVHSSLGLIDLSPTNLTPVERWNKLTEMLLSEANEWGRDERGQRYPTGEYLELLSRKAMPSELNSSLVSTGSAFGVIDIVITLGRVIHLDTAREISSPHRYLPASQFQKTDIPIGGQIGSWIGTPIQGTAIDTSRDYPPSPSNLNSFALGVNPKDTSRSSSTNQISHIVAPSRYQRDRSTSGSVEIGTPTADGILHNTGSQSQAAVRRAASMSARIPAALAIAPIPRPPHPQRPENVPQKRYRGSEPVLPPSPPAKRQKTAKLFEELPFDLNTAAYLSTRARRSASMPFAQTPPKRQSESDIKRKRSVNQSKSALYNAESSEMQVAGTPLTPKKDKLDNQKIPGSGAPLKKKPRSSNYNPKLSNRPQNLRRKNSAGEWIIPPCRKNSSGEWETPTKGGQVKAASVLGGHADEATREENEKIFQPVFTISSDNTSRNIAIGPSIPDGTSPSRDKATLKESIYPRAALEQANKIAIPTIVTEIKKENITPSKAARQASEIASTAISTKFTDGFPDVAFGEAESAQKKEPLGTSPTKFRKAALDKYFRELKKDGPVSGNKNKPRKRTLRIRFFQANINPDGEIVGDGCGDRRWLVRRCIAPEYVPVSGSGKKSTSYTLFEKPESFSAFATRSQGEKVTNVMTNSALKAAARPFRKSSIGHCAESSIANISTIATLRDTTLGIPQHHQNFDTNQPRPRFVVPNHNSRVLKLVRRHGVATEMDGIKQKAQGTSGEAILSNPMDKKFAADATNHFDGRHEGDSSAVATNSESPNILQQDRGSASAKEPPPDSNSEVQTVQEEQASVQLPADRIVPKHPFRPRTVGSTELKALLESHDRHNIVNTSLGAPLGMMRSQLMTRASRKAISFKSHKIIGPCKLVTDTQVSSEKTTAQPPVSITRAPRRRSSSGQFIENTAVTAVFETHAKDKDGGLSNIADAQTNGNANSRAPSSEVKKPVPRKQRSETPKPSIITTIGCDLSLPGAGELPPSDSLTTQTTKNGASRCQTGQGTTTGTMMGFKEEKVKSLRKREIPVIKPSGAPIDRQASQRQKNQETTLQSGADNEMKFGEAAEEVDVALKQVYKANTEINKAAGDLESLIPHTPAQRKFQHAVGVGTSNAKTGEVSIIDMHRGQGQNTPNISAPAYGINPWKPGRLCDDSILTYAKDEHWDRLERNAVTGQMCRRVRLQEEGYFKAFSVLMGVRYVVVGSGVMKDL